jgi:hypothetical protein
MTAQLILLPQLIGTSLSLTHTHTYSLSVSISLSFSLFLTLTTTLFLLSGYELLINYVHDVAAGQIFSTLAFSFLESTDPSLKL